MQFHCFLRMYCGCDVRQYNLIHCGSRRLPRGQEAPGDLLPHSGGGVLSPLGVMHTFTNYRNNNIHRTQLVTQNESMDTNALCHIDFALSNIVLVFR